MFLFFAKNRQQNAFGDILQGKKVFFKSCTWQWLYKKNYKELQAIPSFHGIHRVEFLSMLLILQFHGWNLPLHVKDNITTHFSSASNLKNICLFPRYFVHSQNQWNYNDFHVWAKDRSLLNAVPKLMSITINKQENSETPIKQYTNDKLKENFLKET